MVEVTIKRYQKLRAPWGTRSFFVCGAARETRSQIISLWAKFPRPRLDASSRPAGASVAFESLLCAIHCVHVLEERLELSSLTACDFESHVYTIPPLQQCTALFSTYWLSVIEIYQYSHFFSIGSVLQWHRYVISKRCNFLGRGQ